MDALILAGGENRRFLYHKGLVEIEGKKLIEITFSLLKKYTYKCQDAVIPFFGGNPQPFIGVYFHKIKDLMEERIRYNRRAMRDLLQDIDVYYVPEQDILKVDPEGRSFVNINTREDLQRATGG